MGIQTFLQRRIPTTAMAIAGILIAISAGIAMRFMPDEAVRFAIATPPAFMAGLLIGAAGGAIHLARKIGGFDKRQPQPPIGFTSFCIGASALAYGVAGICLPLYGPDAPAGANIAFTLIGCVGGWLLVHSLRITPD